MSGGPEKPFERWKCDDNDDITGSGERCSIVLTGEGVRLRVCVCGTGDWLKVCRAHQDESEHMKGSVTKKSIRDERKEKKERTVLTSCGECLRENGGTSAHAKVVSIVWGRFA